MRACEPCFPAAANVEHWVLLPCRPLLQVRSELQAYWMSPRAESVVRMPALDTVGEAAAVHDIMQMWRAIQVRVAAMQ